MSSDDVHIVFTNDNKHWLAKILNKNINHCYLLKADRDRLIVYGKSSKFLDLYTINTIGSIINESAIIRATPTGKPMGLFMLNTCVGQVKQYLGIRDPFVWTPHQLYKRLQNGITKKT